MESRNKLRMCRLCLSENECFINIFEMNDWQGFVAAEVISDLLQIKVSETDRYPHVVCSTCLTKLTDFKLFKEFCQKSKVTYDKMFILSECLVMPQPKMDEESESLVSPHSSATVNPTPSNDEVISSDLTASGITVKVEPLENEVIEFRTSEYSSASVNHTSSNDEVISSGMTVMFESLEDAGLGCSGLELCEEDPLKGASSDESDHDHSHLELFEQNRLEEASSDMERGNDTAPEKGVENSKGRFECYHCNKVYMTKSDLRRHMTAHGYGKAYIFEEEEGGKGTVPEKRIRGRKGMFECHCCRKVLMTKGSLKQHLATHRIGIFFTCDMCNRICASKCNLIKHIRQHTGERPYKCTNCSALFSNNSNLKVHMQIHTNIKPFKCKECNLSYSQSSHLKSHMRLHSNLKPYSCGVCHAAFTQKSPLTTHMRTHSGDRPYKCTVCSKAFSQSTHLRKHQVLHSGKKPHPCPHCSKRFSVKQNLKRHLKTVCVEKSQRVEEVLPM